MKVIGSSSFKNYLSPEKRKGLMQIVRDKSIDRLSMSASRNTLNPASKAAHMRMMTMDPSV